MLAAGVRDLIAAGSLGFPRADQALILELGERRGHGSPARAPEPFAALLDHLHQLVPVAGLLGQQTQEREADVAPACAPTSVPARAPAGAAERAALPHPPQRDQVVEVFEPGMTMAALPREEPILRA